MFSSIFRDPRSKVRRTRRSSSPFATTEHNNSSPQDPNRRPSRYDDDNNSIPHSEEEDAIQDEEDNETRGRGPESSDEDTPLLPIFDSSTLDSLPVYMLTHTVRLLVSEKCETVLSWEQLRSPQVSQFLLKPIQQEIRTNHFSAATIYALIANCLQFTKEIATNPGNSGTCKTRAMICELLAIKLLREYNTRGLIDALSYDFDPLQGYLDTTVSGPNNARRSWQVIQKPVSRSARISCLEIAIRAQAKRFLSHPSVVQQLQAIWNGSIVFHNAADSLHRRNNPLVYRDYGTNANSASPRFSKNVHTLTRPRKLVTLYRPKDASLFKLSRLRVPRYRNLLSTISFAVLLALFVAVLTERSVEITPLEVIFWFWAAGYMLDEVVTFNEQGFSLYVASFWNTFDLGILLLLVVHFCLRIYGLVAPIAHQRATANTAYDILAADAILLFPRLFSVLDHYRYFSQLIIAFRMMAADLVAVFILIVIACSGFFVALSLSFGQDNPDDPRSISFALLQLLLGFTPAAWDRWDLYTPLGRAILILYMCITHFVVVTILVTVLTNSFMAVVRNANEEHQFLFAVNTISSVKSDSLFSYMPPMNVLQWLLYPTRYFLPFRRFVQWNRTVIKVTHLPVLLLIYVYEKAVLQSSGIDSMDMIESRATSKTLIRRLPKLVREPSIVNFRQDQALEEVFKQPFDETIRTAFNQRQKKSSTVVAKWMNDMDEDEVAPPEEQDQKIVNRLERRRPIRHRVSIYSKGRNFSRRTRSVASDPADIVSHAGLFSPSERITPSIGPVMSHPGDDDGDDELLTNELDDDDHLTADPREQSQSFLRPPHAQYFDPPQLLVQSRIGQTHHSNTPASRNRLSALTDTDSHSIVVPKRKPQSNARTLSYATMIFNPPDETESDLPSARVQRNESTKRLSPVVSGAATPRSKQISDASGLKSPKRKVLREIRPILPDKRDPAFRSVPNIQGEFGMPRPLQRPRQTSLEMDIVSDIGDNKALGGGYIGALPANIATQMAYAAGGVRQLERERKEEQERMSRLMMARMNSLEEGFRDVIHEMRENMKPKTEGVRSRSLERPQRTAAQQQKERKKGKERVKQTTTPSSSTLVNEEEQRPDTAIQDSKPPAFFTKDATSDMQVENEPTNEQGLSGTQHEE